MKKALFYFGDLRFSLVLFVLFAFFCALATFIESSYNTATAWALVYDANYFAFIQILLGINVAVGLFKYKMFNEKKLPSLIFHAAFLFILLGAGLTRYYGFEGSMHIREGASSADVRTSRSYIWLGVLDDSKIYSNEEYKYISELSFLNDFSFKLPFGKNKQEAKLSYEDYLINAQQVFINDPKKGPLLSLMLAKEGKKGEELLLKKGDVYNIDGVNLGFLATNLPKPFINIDENLQLDSSLDLKFLSMSDGKNGVLPAKSKVNAKLARLYSIKDFSFVIKQVSLHAKEDLKGMDLKGDSHFLSWLKRTFLQSMQAGLRSCFGDPSKWTGLLANFKYFALNDEFKNPVIPANAINLLKLKLSYKGESKEIFVMENAQTKRVVLAGKNFFLRWGSNLEKLPFILSLDKFELKRYAGSNAPSSYASYVKVETKLEKEGAPSMKDKNSFDFKIYMNHVLDHDGYRFYQSSYDTDEKGTILSVNKDPGKLLTYIGYTMLLGGMFLNLLNPYSRFRKLAKLINQDALKNTLGLFLLVLFLLGPVSLKAGEPKFSNEHLDKLGLLVVQKVNGRMVPFNTLASEVLEKIHGSSTVQGLRPEAFMILAMLDFQEWSRQKIVKIARRADIRAKICKILGVKDSKFLSFTDFFTKKGRYKLLKYSENASRKSPSSRGVLDKAILKLDERVNILNMVFSGDLLRIVPVKGDVNQTWLGPVRAMFVLKGEEKVQVASLLKDYFSEAAAASEDGKFAHADLALSKLEAYQEKVGASLIPSKARLKAEIFANKFKIFIYLAPVYLLAGLFMLALIFIKIITPKVKISAFIKFAYIINILSFILLCLGLALRAYIAQRAPWSNSYESMLFIAWCLSLSGIFFAKKSPISLSLTSILAGVVLGVAHLSQMDPQITNLVPVLQSYWLTIHVSVITASYGFLGLSMLLGAFVLILFCLLKEGTPRHERILKNITEATRINEMSMILGISLLTAGNFLGAVWANESWGRYWSWDAKEVWTLVSILIYAAILHIRLIPSLSKQYTFALWSMLAYWSVIMTYFGVNYFLAGMHSYAAGGVAKIPSQVFVVLLVMLALIIFSSFKKKYSQRM